MRLFLLIAAIALLPPTPVIVKRFKKQPTGRADMLMAKVVKPRVLPPRVILLNFRYPTNFPMFSPDWVLDASSNLHDWFIYPESQYKTYIENGVATIWVTNTYPQMYFRVWHP